MTRTNKNGQKPSQWQKFSEKVIPNLTPAKIIETPSKNGETQYGFITICPLGKVDGKANISSSIGKRLRISKFGMKTSGKN